MERKTVAEEVHKQSRRCVLKDVKNIEGSTHPGLWLDRYATYPAPERADQKAPEAWKAGFIQEICQLSNTANTDYYDAFFKRWKQSLKAVRAETRTGTVRTRMVVGLGSEGILETSIALHRTYGVPYIPGSALKGLLAAYIRKHATDPQWGVWVPKQQPHGDQSKDKTMWQPDLLYTFFFGTTDQAGYLTFYDALYVPGSGFTGTPLHADVMTVHHSDYYVGGKTPADSDSPIPVPFLSATGTYLLAIGMPNVNCATEQQKVWINLAFDILAKALAEWGIGAKTSSGYGRLDVAGGDALVTSNGQQASATQQQEQRELAEQKVAQWRKQTVQMNLEQLLDDGCIVKPMGVTKFTLKGFISSEHYGERTPKEGQQMNCTVLGLIERNGEYLAELTWNPPKKKKGK